MAIVKYVLCSLLSILNLESCYVENKSAEEIQNKALLVFGDSIIDTGNNAYLNSTTKVISLHWPYGETFFHHPTGRFSNGRVIPDFIATYAGLPFLSPYLEPMHHVFTLGANFASGGACVLDLSIYIDFPVQVKQFKHVVELLKKDPGDAQVTWILNNAVYLFSIGGGDYYDFYYENLSASEATEKAFVNVVIGNLSVLLREIANVGARKFAFQNMAPLGCAPEDRLLNTRCADNLIAYAVLHNEALTELLKKLEREVPGFKYSVFDYFNALKDRSNNCHDPFFGHMTNTMMNLSSL